MTRIVYLNGEYLPADEAKVSIFDRGYIFGDGVYEVVPVFEGAVVDKAYFLERLDRSLSQIQLDWPCSQQAYLDVMSELVSRNNLREGVVYSQVTRGVAERDFPFPADTAPGFMAFSSQMNLLNNPAAIRPAGNNTCAQNSLAKLARASPSSRCTIHSSIGAAPIER